MPIYEFQCSKGHVTEELFPMSLVPDSIYCKTCRAEIDPNVAFDFGVPRAKRQISTPALKFKGSGFYVNDYGSKR